jgi:hypothetical protein
MLHGAIHIVTWIFQVSNLPRKVAVDTASDLSSRLRELMNSTTLSSLSPLASLAARLDLVTSLDIAEKINGYDHLRILIGPEAQSVYKVRRRMRNTFS